MNPAPPPLVKTPKPPPRCRIGRWLAGLLVLFVVFGGVFSFVARGPDDSLVLQRWRAWTGSPEAQLALAWSYREGRGVPQDYAQAADWLERVAAKGSPRADYDLAVLCYYGMGRKAQPERARVLLERSFTQGYAPAMAFLGMIESLEGDPTRALELLEQAATKGDARAAYLAGLAYCARRSQGEGELARGLRWLERASRAGVPGAKESAEEIWTSMPSDEVERVAEEVYREEAPNP